jgi:hypothetical protein
VFGRSGRCARLVANRRVASGCEPRVAGAPLSAVAWLVLGFFAATGSSQSPIESAIAVECFHDLARIIARRPRPNDGAKLWELEIEKMAIKSIRF